MRAIDVHVHPMNDAYVKASGPFMPAAQRMFKGKFAARPDSQIAEDFRRDDCLAIPIAWDAEAGSGVGLGGAGGQEDFESIQRKAGGQIDGGGGFADSTLLIHDSEYLAHGDSE